METSTPSVAKVLTMVLFALSCVGLLLFLWLSFGGTVPFNPQGYRFQVAFRDAQELSTQADVRIAGVNVGKVIAKQIDPAGNRTLATIQLDNEFAPIHKDATAILRTKTLLGETYVQLTSGSRFAPPLPDGGMLGRGQVHPVVQLDDIFNAFDPSTRQAFKTWQQQLAVAIRGNDANLNNVFGNLPLFAADVTDILTVLDVEHNAVANLVRNTGTVFGALSQNQSALRNLITSSDAVFRTTADNSQKLFEIFQVFPTFLDESKKTMRTLQAFAFNADQACCVAGQTKPVLKELIDLANNLRPTLDQVRQLAPNLKRLFVNLGPLVTVSQTGVPATAEFIRGLACAPGQGVHCPANADTRTLLPSLGNFLEQINPVLWWLGQHPQLLSDFISNGAYSLSGFTTALGGNGVTCPGNRPCGHMLRQFGISGPDSLGIWQNRPASGRGNTYAPPVWLYTPSVFTKGNYPAWDCNNAGGEHPATSDQDPACWVAPPVPGTKRTQQIPHLMHATYPSGT